MTSWAIGADENEEKGAVIGKMNHASAPRRDRRNAT